jgi:hypothetical protein
MSANGFGQRLTAWVVGFLIIAFAELIYFSGVLGSKGPLEVLGLGARWSEYPSDQATRLGLVLLATGLVLVYIGLRIKNRIYRIHQRVAGPASLFMLATWSLSAVVVVFFFDLLNSFPGGGLVGSPVSPVTYGTAGVTFIAILVSITLRNRGMVRVGFLSAFVGTVVGVMIFELPFLFIISPQIGLPLERALFGESPLFCLVFASYSLLYLSPLASLSRYTLFSLGAVFIVLSSWAFLTNFAFPSDPVSFVLNSTSKVLGFATAFSLFVKKGS